MGCVVRKTNRLKLVKNPFVIKFSVSFFPPMPPHVLSDFVVSRPAVTEVQPISEARLRCPDENDGEIRVESEVPGGALNLISSNYPDHGHHGRLHLSRKNARGRAGNRTRDLMVSSQEF